MRRILANGVFDPLHFGHLVHFEAARAMGDALIVAVTSDAAVRRERGADRPLFNQSQRAAMVGALRCVDEVLIVGGSVEALLRAAPQVFVKGPDYVGRIGADVAEHCAQHGIEIRFTAAPKWSASEVVRELRSR